MTNDHTILVHAEGAWSHDEHLDELLKALDARRELTEPAVGYTVRRDVVAVSLWVEAGSEMAAWELANNTLVEEMGAARPPLAGDLATPRGSIPGRKAVPPSLTPLTLG